MNKYVYIYISILYLHDTIIFFPSQYQTPEAPGPGVSKLVVETLLLLGTFIEDHPPVTWASQDVLKRPMSGIVWSVFWTKREFFLAKTDLEVTHFHVIPIPELCSTAGAWRPLGARQVIFHEADVKHRCYELLQLSRSFLSRLELSETPNHIKQDGQCYVYIDVTKICGTMSIYSLHQLDI